MTTQATKRRPLSAFELEGVLGAIKEAPEIEEACLRALKTTYNALLAPFGESVDDYGPTRPIKVGEFGIPFSQSDLIVDALIDKAGHPVVALMAVAEWASHSPMILDEAPL